MKKEIPFIEQKRKRIQKLRKKMKTKKRERKGLGRFGEPDTEGKRK